GLFCGCIWVSSSYAVHHIFKIEITLYSASTRALQLGGIVLFVRSIEGVFSNTLRAFERYGSTVKLSVAVRAGMTLASIILAWLHFGVVAILAANVLLAVVGMVLQAGAVHRLIRSRLLLPSLDEVTLREVCGFGVFSWLQ